MVQEKRLDSECSSAGTLDTSLAKSPINQAIESRMGNTILVYPGYAVLVHTGDAILFQPSLRRVLSPSAAAVLPCVNLHVNKSCTIVPGLFFH